MISVIIPTHNRADLLPRAIESVLNQTYKDWECIIVNDNSKDNTMEVIRHYAEKDDRIKFLEMEENKGGSAPRTRNAGLAIAKGEFIAVLDDDDEWFPEKLEKQLAVMNSDHKIGLVTCGRREVYVNIDFEFDCYSYEEGDLSRHILITNPIGSTSGVLFRKSVMDESGWFDPNMHVMDDYDIFLRVCQNCNIASVPEILFNYYLDFSRSRLTEHIQKVEQDQAYMDKKYAHLYEKLTKKEIDRQEYYRLIWLAELSCRYGYQKEARRYLRHAMKHIIDKVLIARYIFSFFSYKSFLNLRKIKRRIFK